MAEPGRRQLLFTCRNCRNPLALGEDLMSTRFKGKSGPAYMFSHAMNVVLGPKEDRQLITGLYTVADVYCCKCDESLGWKYVRAYNLTDRYKEGTFILEALKMLEEH